MCCFYRHLTFGPGVRKSWALSERRCPVPASRRRLNLEPLSQQTSECLTVLKHLHVGSLRCRPPVAGSAARFLARPVMCWSEQPQVAPGESCQPCQSVCTARAQAEAVWRIFWVSVKLQKELCKCLPRTKENTQSNGNTVKLSVFHKCSVVATFCWIPYSTWPLKWSL